MGCIVHGVAKSQTQRSSFHLQQIHKSHDNSKIRQKGLTFYKAAGVLKVKSSPRSRMRVGPEAARQPGLQSGLPRTCCAPCLLRLKRVLQYQKFTVTFWTPGPMDNITFFFLPAATLRHFKDPGSAQGTPVTVSTSWERPCCLPESPVGPLSPPLSTRDCSLVLTASRPGPRNERLSNLHSPLYSMCCPQ